MLRSGHAACIFLERVEKPTDKRAGTAVLLLQVADADCPCDRPVVGPSAFPTPPPALGSMTIATGNKEFNTTTNG